MIRLDWQVSSGVDQPRGIVRHILKHLFYVFNLIKINKINIF